MMHASYKKIYMLFGSIALLVPQVASAACDDILRYVNYDVSKNYSSLTEDQVNDATFCSAAYSSASSAKKASIEASYKLFSGGASGSASEINTKQSQKCSAKYGRDYLTTLNVQSSEVVSQAALTAVENCYRTSSTAFDVVSLTPSDVAFTAVLRWNGPDDTNISAFNISKYNDIPVAECVATMPDGQSLALGKQLPRSRVITLSCNRISAEYRPGDQSTGSRVFGPGLITIGTAAGSIAIPLVQLSDSLLPNARIAALEQTNRDLQNALDSLVAREGLFGARLNTLEARTPRLIFTNGGLAGWQGPNAERNCDEGAIVGLMVGQNKDFRHRCVKITIEQK